jgi:hypothetical protein
MRRHTHVDSRSADAEVVIYNIRYPICRPGDARRWRKTFKAEKKTFLGRETSPRDQYSYIKYSPDLHRWEYRRPAFYQSRLFISEHFVKLRYPMSHNFSLKVHRSRNIPLWTSSPFIPIIPTAAEDNSPPTFTDPVMEVGTEGDDVFLVIGRFEVFILRLHTQHQCTDKTTLRGPGTATVGFIRCFGSRASWEL